VSYQVRVLQDSGCVATAFASVDLMQVWLFLARRSVRGKPARRWIEERERPAIRRRRRGELLTKRITRFTRSITT
jgi:hypothetical protein